MMAASVEQIARQAVKRVFKDRDILEDAIHGDEFPQIPSDEWQEIILDLWTPELADEGGLTKEAEGRERQIIQEAKRIYEAKRRDIKARVEGLKGEIKQELNDIDKEG